MPLQIQSANLNTNDLSCHFLQGIRNFSSSNVMAKKIEEFVVIGGGLMGAGIAQVKLIYNFMKL